MTREEKIDLVCELLDKHGIKFIYEHVCKLRVHEITGNHR